jgi:hypothetical protein
MRFGPTGVNADQNINFDPGIFAQCIPQRWAARDFMGFPKRKNKTAVR